MVMHMHNDWKNRCFIHTCSHVK